MEIDQRGTEMEGIRKRLKAREAPKGGMCWNCRRPQPSRSQRCPFCGEAQ
jgi:hypothetical protein